MDLKTAKIKYSTTLFQQPDFEERMKAALYVTDQRRSEVKLMVPGENASDVQLTHLLYGAVKLFRVGAGVKSVQTAAVNQISGIEVLPVRLVKTAMSGRMSGSVDYVQPPPAQIKAVSVVQELLRNSLKYLIPLQREILWKFAGLERQIMLYRLERQGEFDRNQSRSASCTAKCAKY